jgi:hypothetical protein
LRRAAAYLALASLLALFYWQALHPGLAFAALDGNAVTASSPAVDTASLPHGGAHLPSLCSICRALAQTRLGVRSPALATTRWVDAPGLRVALALADAAPRAPWRASIGRRAPPGALPIQYP